MSTVAFIVAATWILPIIGIAILHARLARDVRRRLDAIAADRSFESAQDARVAIAATRTVRPLAMAGHEDRPTEAALDASRSGRVDIRSLNERRLFAISVN